MNAFLVRAYNTVADFPNLGEDGEMAVALAPVKALYSFDTISQAWQLLGTVGGAVTSVTDDGNTVVVVDNTVPTAPVITFAGVIVDGVTITGDGTVGNPLTAVGTGTVTNFSFTNANGVSGVVTNPTTTPDLTISLGAITPSSVAAVGTVTGSNLSGTNTGDVTLAGQNYLSIAGQVITANPVNLTTTNVTGILPVANGGTGASSFTQGSVIFAGVGGNLSQDNLNFFWDAVNLQLNLAAGGTAALPGITFANTNNGIYSTNGNSVSFATSGTSRFTLDSTSFRSTTTGGGIVKTGAGTAALPAFSWVGDTNTGIWNSAPDSIGFSASGTTRFSINDTGGFFGAANGSPLIRSQAGTVGAPTYSFLNNTNVGMWSDAANILKFSSASTLRMTINASGRIFIGNGSGATALLHISAGTATASTAPLKFTSGTNLTVAEAGAMEFTTDDLFFTITTGAARKNITLWDTLGTSGRVPFATTNGRLTDSADMTFAASTLTVTNFGATTITGTQTYADAINMVFNATTGTKIGTAVTQKIGFWNVAPVVQPAGANQAAITDSTGGTPSFTLVDVGVVPTQANINDNFASINRQLDAIRTALVNSGMIKGAA